LPSPADSFARNLELENELARSLSALNILRRAHNIAQWIHIMYLDTQTISLNELPQLLRRLLQLLARGDVIEQRRTNKLDVLRREATVNSSVPW
jgi:hypothetical protein